MYRDIYFKKSKEFGLYRYICCILYFKICFLLKEYLIYSNDRNHLSFFYYCYGLQS